MDGVVSKLLVPLQNGKQLVQEGALTALASVADSSQEHFQKNYDAVMPYLKAILVNATDKSNRMLRAKAMECISLVGMAVGKEKVRDDAKQWQMQKILLQEKPLVGLYYSSYSEYRMKLVKVMRIGTRCFFR